MTAKKSKLNRYLGYFILFLSIFFISNKIIYAEEYSISPEEFGAVGDGITDDTVALQKTFQYACNNDGVTIKFGENRNYLISSGLTLPRTCILDGNNSKITVKEIKSFNQGGNYSYQFFAEYAYNAHADRLDWKDLQIDFSPALLLNSEGKVKEYNLFRFYDLETFQMNNVQIVSKGDERNSINLFKFCGQGNIFMDNCSFSIEQRGTVGSVLWIQSTLSNGYYARINNSTFYSTALDEVISVFCSGSHDVVFDNCKIEKNYYDTYYDKNQNLVKGVGPFINSVYQSKDRSNNAVVEHYVTYQNCDLTCKPLNPQSDIYVTFCGLNCYYGDTAITSFVGCNIVAYNITGLVGGEQAVNNQYMTNIADNRIFHNKIKAVYDKCNININASKFGLMKSNSSNLEIKECNITTNKLLDYTYANLRTVTGYKLSIVDSYILITGDNDDIFRVNSRAREQYYIVDNVFETTNGKENVSFLTEKNTDDGYTGSFYTHRWYSYYNFHAEGNVLNGKSIEDMNKY